ncbi:thiol-disulfide oxidoreductase DCC family protein [Neobacillus sp. OS1-32]|uniref:Thiol-disulfide oxidoreductase DCC family protein n=1 Tax=Neobacillus paridis TaxID=2803862 RepID=A0ABS1TPU8_9BACI|nr:MULTISPECIES: thiol-disulfide oxidoreductase DCC family protein [Neobacillus]MBL4953331.1 thiol-disulfide oxidoreductase DCC family protein [Neobacillus paridis]WML29578.1 thiol-disulfide oxidoreductase DCC family protein [Neobacillus sp. OS1-32]
MDKIILFDGECNLCDHSVQFIIKRDDKALYRFASIQSSVGREILLNYNVDENTDSFILVENNQCYYKSSAALRVCKNLNGAWKFLSIFLFLPSGFRDFFYDVIAKNRYKWFGKKDSCMLPSPEIRKRFL